MLYALSFHRDGTKTGLVVVDAESYDDAERQALELSDDEEVRLAYPVPDELPPVGKRV